MKQRRILTVLGVVFAVLCVAATIIATLVTRSARSGFEKYTVRPAATQANGEPETGGEGGSQTAPEKSAIDFKALLKESNDVAAWLRINGTAVDYPVMYREGDKGYYLRRDLYGDYSNAGSLFIEDYNRPDFTDPVTIIYGHHLASGEMFGKLQATYTNAETFKKCQEIIVYFSEKELHYKVFCAVPLDNAHILYYHDFDNESVYADYFDQMFQIRSLQAVFDEEYKPQPGDRVLMLSTCYSTDYSRRFVVMAKLTDEFVYSE